MKKTFLVIVSVLLNAMLLQAASITDDFNRADRAANGNGALIGANWVSSGGGWGIEDGRLIQNMSSTQGNAVLYNTAVSTVRGDGLTVSLAVMALANGTWAGLVFDYKDENNFYYFRYKAGAGNYSLSRRVNGDISHLVNAAQAGIFELNTDYTLTVASSNADTFRYQIKNRADGTVLVSGTATDAEAPLAGGYAGILQSTPGANRNSFDNFSLAVSKFVEQFVADDEEHGSDGVIPTVVKGGAVSAGLPVTLAGMPAAKASPERPSVTNSIGMELVYIAPGSFMMGQEGPPADYHMVNHPEKFDDADWDERLVHEVEITTGFYMGATEVTLEQYRLFDPGFERHDGAADEAVRFVSWNDAAAFCEWLSAKEGKPYRLPTEAEWEYACRAGTTTLFHFGDELPEGFHQWFGNRNFRAYFFRDRSMPEEYTLKHGRPVLHVAQTPPSEWGLYDMHGNVAEWCYDWYGPYEVGPRIDPLGRSDGDFRVIRGGSHSVFTRQLRSANRAGWLPEASNDMTGFRVVLGELPLGQYLPRTPPPEVDVRQDTVTPKPVPADVPYFSGPKSFVIIPPRSLGPLFSRHNHSPSITECPNGDLLVVWYSCVLEQGIELCNASSRLRYGATEWEPALPFWDGPDVNDHGPKIWWDEEGTLFHFVSGISEKVMRTSTDNGVTWSKARIINNRGAEFGNRLLRLRDGTLVLSSDSREEGLVYSQDGGESWTTVEVEGRKSDFRPGGQGYRYPGIHAAMVELSDGRIMAVSRNTPEQEQAPFEFKTPVSYSADLGKTWTYELTEFPAIGSTQRDAMIRLREGPILFCSFTDQRSAFDNPKGLHFKASDGAKFTGFGLFAALSYDEGRTWPVRRLITPGGPDRIVEGHSSVFTLGDTSAEQNGYLDVTQTRDGNIHLITSKNHYVFNLAWLEALPAPPGK